MARPQKTGLDYFPFDVDFFDDDKLQFVSARFGSKGENIAIKLLCKIYKENGYYYNWGEDEALLFAKRVGGDIQHSLVNDIVHELIKRGFFDKGMFDTFKILTSNGIQKRYTQIVQNSKLKRPKIQSKFRVYSEESEKNSEEKNKSGVYSEEIDKSSEEIAKNSEESTQSKVNKSKEKKIKESIGAPSDFFDKTIQERKSFFKTILKKYESEYGYEMMNEFYKYWTQVVNDDRMYFEVQNDFYPNIRLRNWKSLGFEKSKKQTEENPDFKKLKELYGSNQ